MALRKKLIAAGLMADDSKNSITYSTSQSSSSRWNIPRFLRRQPYWQTITHVKDNKPHQIIIAYYQLLFELEAAQVRFLQLLYKQGFTISFRIAPGEYLETKNFKEFEVNIGKYRPASKAKIYEELAKKNENLENYCIIDGAKQAELFESLMRFLQINSNEVSQFKSNLSSIHLTKAIQGISDDALDDLCHYIHQQSISRLTYLYEITPASRSKHYTFSWENVTDLKRLKKLFIFLKNGLRDEAFFLSEQFSDDLTELTITDITVTHIDITHFKSLITLNLKDCYYLVELIGIENLPKLQKVSLGNQRKSNTTLIHRMPALGSVSELTISECDPQDPAIPIDKKFPNLLKANIFLYANPKSICWSGSQYSTMEDLTLTGGQFKQVDLSKFENLKRLTLYDWPSYYEIIGLANSTDIEELSLDSARMKELDLSPFKKLRKLVLTRCIDLVSITGIDQCEYLESLLIKESSKLEKIDGLEKCRQLADLEITSPLCKFNLADNSKLRRVTLTYDLNNIFDYKLHYLEELVFFFTSRSADKAVTLDFSAYPRLRTLDILDNKSEAKKIVGLNKCSELKTISINQFGGLDCLDISANQRLESLVLRGNHNLKTIIGLSECQGLEKLIISDCVKISGEMKEQKKKIKARIEQDMRNFISYERLSSHAAFTPESLPISFTYEGAISLLIDYSKPPVINNSHQRECSRLNAQLTYEKDTDEAELEIQKIFASNGDEPDPFVAEYRHVIFDSIVLNGDGVVTMQESEFQAPRKINLPDKAILDHHTYTATVFLQLQKNNYVCLRGLSADDELLCISDREDIDVYYEDNKKRYWVKLKDNSRYEQYNRVFQYVLKKDPHYYQHEVNLLDNTYVPLLPTALERALDKYFDEHKDFINKNDSKQEILEKITKHCRKFEKKKLAIPHETESNHIAEFIEIMDKMAGSCLHRSVVFMTLCHYFGIPAQVIKNGIHAYPEVFIKKNNQIKMLAVNIGGSSAKFKIKEIPKMPPSVRQLSQKMKSLPKDIAWEREPMLKENKLNIAANAAIDFNRKKEPRIMEQQKVDWRPFFIPDDKWLANCLSYKDVFQHVLNKPATYLFRTAYPKEAWRYHEAMFDFCRSMNMPMLYLDSPEDLNEYFSPVQFHDTTKEKVSVPYSVIDGPLKKILQADKGVILINWSAFSPTERAIYKSMLDKPPTLNGVRLARNIRVIGLLDINTEANDVFLSRCHELKLPIHLVPFEVSQATSDNPNPVDMIDQSISVNLYQRTDWMRSLLHDPVPRGDDMLVRNGKLIEAMQAGCELIIYNPPENDVAYNNLLHRLLTEKKIYSNGHIITAKTGFKLTVKQKRTVLEPHPQVFFHNDELPIFIQKRYYLNRETYPHLFELQHIDANDRIFILDGWLKEYKPGDVFIVTESLTDDEWQRIIEEINVLQESQIANLHFYAEADVRLPFTEARMKDVKLHEEKVLALANLQPFVMAAASTHIVTNDPNFVIDQLQSKLKIANKDIFHLTNDNLWNELMESVGLNIVENKIRATRNESRCLKQLKRVGTTIILSGDLTKENYAVLQSLFCDHPHIYVNGIRVDVKAKVIWVSKPQKFATITESVEGAFTVDVSDYTLRLQAELSGVDYDMLKKINLYYQFIGKLKINSDLYPSYYNYAKYKKIYEYFMYAKHNGVAGNPLKSIVAYHYRKDSEAYAYLNVIAKILFGNTSKSYVKVEKLKKLISSINNEDQFISHFWLIANCFSVSILQEILGKYVETNLDMTFEKISDLSKLLSKKMLPTLASVVPTLVNDSWFSSMYDASMATNQVTKLTLINQSLFGRLDKQNQRLVSAIVDPKKRLVFLIGDSGTGKTTAVTAIAKSLKRNKYDGEAKITAWLQDKKGILLLDEVNLSESGKWELFQGLRFNPPVIHYQGLKHQLKPEQKVVVTGNPVHYPGRHFHDVLWDHAHLIWFAPFQASFIKENVVKTISDLFGRVLTENEIQQLDITANLISNVYEYLRISPDRIGEVTPRDIDNICARLVLIIQKNKLNTWSVVLAKTIYDEMLGIFVNDKAVQKFKAYLSKECGSWSQEVQKAPENLQIVIPPESFSTWNILQDALALRNKRIANKNNYPGKLGVLLEGPSGVGKTTLYLNALQHAGYSLTASNSQKRFYQITAGSENVKELLIKAFHEGSIVVLDELNVGENIENVLNQLLSGVDLEGKPAKLAGFCVLASKNPDHYMGCHSISRAIMNRLNIIHVDEYTKYGLRYISMKKSHPDPDGFVETFFKVRREHPNVNTRNFFDALKSSVIKR